MKHGAVRRQRGNGREAEVLCVGSLELREVCAPGSNGAGVFGWPEDGPRLGKRKRYHSVSKCCHEWGLPGVQAALSCFPGHPPAKRPGHLPGQSWAGDKCPWRECAIQGWARALGGPQVAPSVGSPACPGHTGKVKGSPAQPSSPPWGFLCTSCLLALLSAQSWPAGPDTGVWAVTVCLVSLSLTGTANFLFNVLLIY